MAFSARRSLATSLSRHLTRRPHPSLSHLVPSHHDRRQDPSSSSSSAPPNPTQRHPPFPSGDLRRRSRSQNLPFPHPIPFPFCARRSFSTSSPPPVGVIDAVARLISDAASSVVAEFPSPFSEVSATAADSFLPVAAVQHLIDAVHSITGLNWWASIAVTMLLVRTATIPLLVRQIKAENRLSALKPEIMAFIKEGDGTHNRGKRAEKKFFELLKRHDVSPLTPFKLLFIQGPIILSFSCAIRNMIEKVPSLKGGGAHWFTDLTTPDELYILPVLTSMTMAAQELNLKARIEGDPTPLQKVAKNTNRALAFLIIPLSMSLCKVKILTSMYKEFGYTWNAAIRRPAVRHYFGLPHLVPRPAPAPAPAQVPALTSPDLSEGPESMPAVDSPPAAKGSEQSSCEPNDGTVDVEKKRRTPRVIINRVRSDCSSSDVQ